MNRPHAFSLWRWFALALCGLPLLAQAHKPSDSYLTLRTDPGNAHIAVRWDIALRDLDYVLQLDRDNNGALTWGEVRGRSDDIAHYARAGLSLQSAGQACPWRSTGPLQLEKHSDGTYAVLSLSADCPVLTDALQMTYTLLREVDPSHRGLAQWLPSAEAGALSVVLGGSKAEQSLPLTAPDGWRTFTQYVVEGVWHIWIGFDHILFLLALLLPAVLVYRDRQWQGTERFGSALSQVVKVVTAFTVAHSVTLSLAALGILTLPSRVVESAIAASVVLAALNNLRGTADNRRWPMAFAFGLVHGFGFASVLADLGLPQNALVLALVGFNVGVELGQLAIVAVFLPLAFALRRSGFYRQAVFKAGSLLIAALALWWFAERAFNL